MKLWVPQLAITALVLALVIGFISSIFNLIPDFIKRLPFARTLIFTISIYFGLMILSRSKL